MCAIGISKLGNGWIYILLAVAVFAHWGLSGYKVILCAGVNAGVTHSLYPLIKRRYRRRRPFKVDPELSSLLATLDEHSFPSGHAMTLAAVLTPIVMLWPAAANSRRLDVPRTGLVPDRDGPSLSERRPRGRVAGNRAGLSDLPGVHFHLVRRRRGRLSAPNASWVCVPHRSIRTSRERRLQDSAKYRAASGVFAREEKNMIELLVAILAFLCILGSAFVGFMINSRSVLLREQV